MKNQIAQLIYDTYKGNIPTKFAQMDKNVREDKIRKEIFKVLGLDDYERVAFRRAMKVHDKEVFNIIEEIADQVLLDGEYKEEIFVKSFVEVKNSVLGDKNEFYSDVRNELELVEFSGNHWDLERSRIDVGGKMSPKIRTWGVKVYDEFERIMSGRSDFAKLITYIMEAVDRKICEIAKTTFMRGIGNLPAEFKYKGTYNKKKILKVVQHVQASTGIKPILLGTRVALSNLQDMTEFSTNMKDELNLTGGLSKWQGYDCIEIEQTHKVGTFEFTWDDSQVYILTGGDKLVKLYLEGDTETKEINDGITNADRSTEFTLQFKGGCGVAFNKMVGNITFE